MLDRVCEGEVPSKHHLQLRSTTGDLRFEECLTRNGFDGAYSLLYHTHRPHPSRSLPAAHGWKAPQRAPKELLERRHFRSFELSSVGAPVNARKPLLFNKNLVLSILHPTTEDPVYVCNGDHDELLFIHEGGGIVRSPFGDLPFAAGDYVCIPKGILYRILPTAKNQKWLSIQCDDLRIPRQWRNDIGQIRMDAPFCHRDFRRPSFLGPKEEGIRELVVQREGKFYGFHLENPPLDLVGWDGTVYPWVFPIERFQPRVGLVHLPPDWHGTFAAKNALICSFVPRPVDFHPEAIPCPYPHSSVDCDEVLYYVRGNFTSRKGVGPGSISFHPYGILHGPHAGNYEASIGTHKTDEMAVMIDTTEALHATPEAIDIEDINYHRGF